MNNFDFCVIGAGIVGLSTAYSLRLKYPKSRILVIEKENQPAKHQTGRNSGVIHAGVYYPPGSLKAKLCREGLRETKEFCQKFNVPTNECGKLIVATTSNEVDQLDQLAERANANDLFLQRYSQKVLKSKEPNIAGIEALYSPETAIVDYREMSNRLMELLISLSVEFSFDSLVEKIDETGNCVIIKAGQAEFKCNYLIACSGLQSDRLAKLSGVEIDFKIIPFRGEYYQLPASKRGIISHLIYPVPDLSQPFLGVHLTLMIDGAITVGPNAVIGFSREGYDKWSFSWNDMIDYANYPGFWKLLYKYRSSALHELKGSLLKSAYLQECQKYCPSLTLPDLLPYKAGIRAQAVLDTGEIVNDFLFKQTERMLHVCNAPSPAATSALPIGRMIAEKCWI